WDLLNQIVTLLEPFDDATTYFSGSQYATLSIIYSLIEALKYIFVEFDITSDAQNNKQNKPNFCHEELSDDDSDNLEFDTSELTVDSSQIINLLASLLNSRLRTLSNWDEETQERAKAKLTHQFKNIATSNYE
ncbi:5660_t:CDS:2, partial [Racocetra persica]